MLEPVTRQSPDLKSLAARINEEHAAAEGHARSAVEHAVIAGRLLIEAKAQVPNEG
jgi:hypothetical protein